MPTGMSIVDVPFSHGSLGINCERAATQADDQAVHSVLAPIEGKHAELVQTPSELVREFRFGDITALTDRTADGI